MLGQITKLKWETREDVHRNLYIFSLILIIGTLPFTYLYNSIAIAIAGINWLAEGNFVYKLKQLRANKLIWLFASFYLLILTSLLYSENLTEGLFDLQVKSSLLIFPVLIGTSQKLSKNELHLILKFFVLICVVAGLICHYDAVVRLIAENKPLSGIFGGYYTYSFLVEVIDIHPAYFSMYLCLAVFATAYLLFYDCAHHSIISKMLLWAATLYLTFLIFHLASRMGIVSFFIMMIIALLVFFNQRKQLLKGILIVSGFIALVLLIVFASDRNRERFVHIVKPKIRTEFGSNVEFHSLPVRLPIWYCSWEVIKRNPWVGVGVGDIHNELNNSYKINGFEYGMKHNYNTHNQFIETAVAFGLIGLLVLLLNLIIPLRKALKQRRYLYAVFLLLVILSFLTENILNTQKGVVFFAFFNSLFAFNLLTQPDGVTGE